MSVDLSFTANAIISNTLRDEAFLDTVKIGSVSGLSYGVNRLTKYGSNPINDVTLSNDKPDHNFGYSSSHYTGTTTQIFAVGGDYDWTNVNSIYLETTDGTTLQRLNLGLVSFNGNTNNNITTPSGVPRPLFHVLYEPTLPATPYVWVGQIAGSLPMVIGIYTGTDGKNWTQVKTINDFTGTGYCEPMAVWRRTDLKWVIYYQAYSGGIRKVGMLLSDSSDITGSWTDQGVIINSTNSDYHLYHAGGWVDGELVYVPVGIFDGNYTPGSLVGYDDRIYKAELYVGRANDGSSLTLKDTDWLFTSTNSSDWDYSEIVVGNNMTKVGDEWRMYYGGDTNPHHVTPEGRRDFGLATIGYGRIGQLSGTGYVILDTVTATVSSNITINCNGSIEVELLDPTTSAVIPGYEKTNCDTISGDNYSKLVTWGGSAVTPTSYKAKIYLNSSAILYHVNIVEDTAGTITVGASSYITQVGRKITYSSTIANPGTDRVSVACTVVSANGGFLRTAGAGSSRFTFSPDNSTWTSTLEIPTGTSTVYLSVVPQAGDSNLVAQIGVPI